MCPRPELNTAANFTHDHVYWITARLCAKAFAQTMQEVAGNSISRDGFIQDGDHRWHPLPTLVNRYNSGIDDNVKDCYDSHTSVKSSFKL